MCIEVPFDDGNNYKGTIINVLWEAESFSLLVWFDDNTTEVINFPEEGVRLIKDNDGNPMFNNRFEDIDISTFMNVSSISEVGR